MKRGIYSDFFGGIIALSVVFTGACGAIQSARNISSETIPAAAPILTDEAASEREIRFFENRLEKDPEDFAANNRLAALYLQKLRETGDAQFLNLAQRAAKRSLESVPDVRNSGGIAALALTEFAAHEFASAKAHALRLIELEPRKSYPQSILGDALLELGDYEQAETAYKKIVAFDGGISDGSETRFARLAILKGDNAAAQRHFANALAFALDQSAPPSRETVAWLRWQLGETAFAVGDYETAEKNFRDALTTFPDYFRAVASLGKTLAAENDLNGAIENYEKAVRLLPDPQFVAALGDLYKLAGNDEKANDQYELVEQIGHLNALNGSLYNRQLALFYADHDLKQEEAFNLAAKEYEIRKDIYGADALAWTAFKAGKLEDARAAIKDALRLNTQDAKLFYHAGMINLASGDQTAARNYLRRALELSPRFDALQSVIAEKNLQN